MHDGFRIKTSGFKHSCQPNAVTVQKPIGPFQVRAIANIKAGQEINLNLCSDPFYGFKNKKQRQKSLLNAPPFVLCSCDLCENDVDIDADPRG
jgi:SET domain-containing protein